MYGFTEATLDSLILNILPQESGYTPLTDDQFTDSQDIQQHILLTLIQALRENANFNIEAVSIIKIFTTQLVLPQVCKSRFTGLAAT